MSENRNRETHIRVKVIPRSSKNEIVGKENHVFKMKITAPPAEGKANKALQQLLAKRLGVPARDVEIVSGERSRIKSIRIHGRTPEDVEKTLTG